MGIYDRDYYRHEGPGFLSTFGGQVTKWLILINVIVFVFQLVTIPRGPYGAPGLHGPNYSRGLVTDWLILDTSDVLQGQVWRLLTYAFLHDPGSLFHILFNMLFLWWFGRELEEMYGSREFLTFYLISALLGGVLFVLTVMLKLSPNVPCLGASGAVTAIMVLFACYFPNRIILLFFILPVPIWLLVLLSVALDSFGFLTGTAGRTAVVVHLAGAAFGFVYYKRQWRLLRLTEGLRSWFRSRRRARPRLRVYREEVPAAPLPVSAPAAPDLDEHLEAQVDAVLEKVSRHGQESLTESEREILFRASEVYKKRRP